MKSSSKSADDGVIDESKNPFGCPTWIKQPCRKFTEWRKKQALPLLFHTSDEVKKKGKYPAFVAIRLGYAEMIDNRLVPTAKWRREQPELVSRSNGDTGEKEGPMSKEIEKWYQELAEQTFLDAAFFDPFANLLEHYRQVILEGPPGSGKTFVAEKFAQWWTTEGTSEAGPGSRYEVI